MAEHASDDAQAQRALDFLERITQVLATTGLREHCRDGIALCAAINALEDDAVRDVLDARSSFEQIKIAQYLSESKANLRAFLAAARAYGVGADALFEPGDLFDERDDDGKLIACLCALAARRGERPPASRAAAARYRSSPSPSLPPAPPPPPPSPPARAPTPPVDARADAHRRGRACRLPARSRPPLEGRLEALSRRASVGQKAAPPAARPRPLRTRRSIRDAAAAPAAVAAAPTPRPRRRPRGSASVFESLTDSIGITSPPAEADAGAGSEPTVYVVIGTFNAGNAPIDNLEGWIEAAARSRAGSARMWSRRPAGVDVGLEQGAPLARQPRGARARGRRRRRERRRRVRPPRDALGAAELELRGVRERLERRGRRVRRAPRPRVRVPRARHARPDAPRRLCAHARAAPLARGRRHGRPQLAPDGLRARDEAAATENCGLGHVVANKGGQLFALQLCETTTLVFVSAHLNAHEGEAHRKRRNDDVAEILGGARAGKGGGAGSGLEAAAAAGGAAF